MLFVFLWLTPLSTMPSRPIRVVAKGRISFLLMTEEGSMWDTPHLSFLSTHPWMVTGCLQVSASTYNTAMNMGCRSCFKIVISCLLDEHPEVGFPEPMMVQFFTFGGNSILFSLAVGGSLHSYQQRIRWNWGFLICEMERRISIGIVEARLNIMLMKCLW